MRAICSLRRGFPALSCRSRHIVVIFVFGFGGICGTSICPMPGVRERQGSSGLKTGGGANGAVGAEEGVRACHSAGGPGNSRAKASKRHAHDRPALLSPRPERSPAAFLELAKGAGESALALARTGRHMTACKTRTPQRASSNRGNDIPDQTFV